MKLLRLNINCCLKYAHQQIISLDKGHLFKHRFTACCNPRIASAVLATALQSVCLSLRPSVRPSVTRRYCEIKLFQQLYFISDVTPEMKQNYFSGYNNSISFQTCFHMLK